MRFALRAAATAAVLAASATGAQTAAAGPPSNYDQDVIGANDVLRTGTYAKTLTFTLSTTNP